jgi:hypothetical protein
MRNPLNSWDRTDSYYEDGKYIIGPNDLGLCGRLIDGGAEHRKFMRQIFVSVDITAPIYWWSEYDTYKVGTVANSTSTMHTLSKFPIAKEMFELDENEGEVWNDVIAALEKLRLQYNETKDYRYFRAMKQLLPSSFRQTRTCTMSYETLRAMIGQRRRHRLKEWSNDFIAWTRTLPYAAELLFRGYDD